MIKKPFEFKYTDYPLIPIKFTYNDRQTPIIESLLDSGGDFIVIPKAIATYLGLKLKKAGFVDTAGGETHLFKSSVTMSIINNDKELTYKDLEIHISARNDIPVLLGRKPIFEDHEIIFKKHENKLILEHI
ncbi:MAG: retropepsin-like aspartic protease [Thermoplasmatota archaeon]